MNAWIKTESARSHLRNGKYAEGFKSNSTEVLLKCGYQSRDTAAKEQVTFSEQAITTFFRTNEKMSLDEKVIAFKVMLDSFWSQAKISRLFLPIR